MLLKINLWKACLQWNPVLAMWGYIPGSYIGIKSHWSLFCWFQLTDSGDFSGLLEMPVAQGNVFCWWCSVIQSEGMERVRTPGNKKDFLRNIKQFPLFWGTVLWGKINCALYLGICWQLANTSWREWIACILAYCFLAVLSPLHTVFSCHEFSFFKNLLLHFQISLFQITFLDSPTHPLVKWTTFIAIWCIQYDKYL